ncbi:hypothetical protein OC846_003130 [Tilletia horrida]|uniref:Uncharacterized protein n=1 Tax=Tilletia horrida TaxID=155126 RepID=A0AAN6JRJ8_9BASI|nr:hypothetical protein OC845_003796 [Tilletia horrida]KAK0551844.1 hypothetical protein OC846_003130 [Tilletia horrida]
MSFVTFVTNASEVNGRLLDIGIWHGNPHQLRTRFPSQETAALRSILVDHIHNRPIAADALEAALEAAVDGQDLLQINPVLLSRTLDEVKSRARAKLKAHGEDGERQDRENSLAFNEPGYTRHVLAGKFLKEHVWEACLYPLGREINRMTCCIHDERGMASWIKFVPEEAKPHYELNDVPDAVVGLMLTPKQKRVVRSMNINVESDNGPPPHNPDADVTPELLPLMVCSYFANWARPGDKLHPDSDLFIDRCCVRAYSALVAMRKFYQAAKKLAHDKGKQLPPAPPLLVAIFVDNYLDIWALEGVPEADRATNKGMPYRCAKMETIHMSKHHEETTIIHAWQIRQWSATLLQNYLDALTAL